MFWPKLVDPTLGVLRRRWGKWRGRVWVEAINGDLQIEIESLQQVDPWIAITSARRIVENFRQLQLDFALPLYDDYLFYKKLDLEEGGFTEEDFQRHPVVTGPTDIWSVLKPYKLWHGGTIDQYLGNAYLLVDVDWPNPHYFQVYFLLNNSEWKHMHTELVG
jgi:hypothetical protein